MKKLFFTLLLILATEWLPAQNRINYKIVGGIGVSNLYGKDTEHSKVKFAYTIGGGAEYHFNRTWSALSGLHFTAKGARVDEGFSMRLCYLELPMQAGFRIYPSNQISLLVKGGPYFAYGIAGKAKLEYAGFASGKMDCFTKDGLHLRRFDAGLDLGADAEFKHFFAGMDIQFGFIPVVRDTDDAHHGVGKNIALLFTFGYTF